MFAEKLRVTWQTRPAVYGDSKKPLGDFFSIGLGDASGTLYWIARIVREKVH
jgi:hypothetical protein